jgi:hypothetical protein
MAFTFHIAGPRAESKSIQYARRRSLIFFGFAFVRTSANETID